MESAYKLAIEIIANAKTFETSVNQAADSTNVLATKTKEATDEVKKEVDSVKGTFGKMGEDSGKVMSSLGNAIGGVKGEIVSFAGEIATVAGPIGLIVLAIGGIAMAWKEAQKEVNDYLERVEKAGMDPAIYTKSSKQALDETKSAAHGGVTEGISLREEAERRLGVFGAAYTAEQRKQLEAQKALGIQMVKDNQELLKGMGYQDGLLQSQVTRVGWIQKYNKLQQEGEKLDEDKISTATGINNLEAELLTIKTQIMGHSGSIADRQKLETEYAEKAKVIADKKLGLVNREFGIKSELFKMTGKSEQAEMLALNTENTKAEINRAYNQDLFNTIRLMNSINKEQGKVVRSAEEMLKIQREINNQSASGYKLGATNAGGDDKAGFANVKQLTKSPLLSHPFVTPAGMDDLRKYNALTKEEIASTVKFAAEEEVLNSKMERQKQIASVLTGSISEVGAAFGNMLAGGEGAMKGLITVMIQAGQKIVDIYLAEAIAATIAGDASIPVVGLVIASAGIAALSAFWAAKVPSFATGGIVSGPTVAQVGEYPGARSNPEVIAPLSSLIGMLGQQQPVPQRMRLALDGQGNLYGYLNYRQRHLNNYR